MRASEVELSIIYQELRSMRSMLGRILHLQEKLMTAASDIETEIGVIAADLTTVSTGVTTLAAAFAAAQAASGDGSISPADAATILANLQGVDTNLKSTAAALTAAVTPPAPTPAPTPPASS